MPRRWCRFALLGMIGVSGYGCVSSEKPPPPLGLTPGLQSKLGAKSDASAPPPSFDPSATGGKGVTAANSFNRTKPSGSGLGVSLPPPQLASNSTAPPVSAPVQPGTTYAPPSADMAARSSTPRGAGIETIQPASATAPLPPVGNTLPPPTEPPMTRANYPQPSAPPPVNLSVPMTDPDPLPRPVPPPPPAAAPPVAPAGPLPPMPAETGIPAPLSPLKSATERPLPGVPAGPLPPAEPLKPLK